MEGLWRVSATALVAALVAGGCGDEPPDEQASPRDTAHVVRITDDGFSPAALRVAVGDRVTFVNRSKEQYHTAVADPRSVIEPTPEPGPADHSGKDVNHAHRRGFATHVLFPGEPQTIVFHARREFRYLCTFHPRMKGVVDVR